MRGDLQTLREALLDLTAVLSSPRPDAALIASAGVDIDRALFPLLMRIEHRGPVGVVELAGLSGRDYTTVSRQVTALEKLGLVRREASTTDRRQRTVSMTPKGRRLTAALDAAREKMLTTALDGWNAKDLKLLARLLRRFADDALSWADEQSDAATTTRE